jgi:predicted Fe-S protein YdhL (DUF1289 family)
MTPHLFLLTFSAISTTLPNQPNNDPSFRSTPCVRLCRYNSNFFNGQVCIGCFRETYEISQWSSLDNREKACALQDAFDRWQCSSSFATLDGSITGDELMQQADAWLKRIE